MDLLQNHERLQLEGSILEALCQRPWLYHEIELLDSYFSDELLKKIWIEIRERLQTGQKIDIASLSNKFSISELKFLFQEDRYLTGTNYIEAVKRLEEDYKRNEILKLSENCNDSGSFLSEMRRIEQIGTSYLITSINDLIPEYVENYKKRKERMHQNGAIGLIHDFKKLSEIVNFEPGELVVLGARTSIGKTAWCLNFAQQVAVYQQRVLFISMEMSTNSLIDRLASGITKNNLHDIKSTIADENFIAQELTAIGKYFFLVHAPGATSETVVNLASKMKFDLVVVDYLQLLRDKQERGELETYRIGRILKNLQRLAGEKKCVVLTAAQLNRDSEKSAEPSIIHLRDSGSIEQDADIIMLLHRDRSITPQDAKLIIAKNRNGKIDNIELTYYPSRQIFLEKP